MTLGRASFGRVAKITFGSLFVRCTEAARQEEAYVTAVENAVFGYGRLQPLLEDATWKTSKITVWNSVVIAYGDGRRERKPPIAESDAELVEAMQFSGPEGAANPRGRSTTPIPTMTLALGESAFVCTPWLSDYRTGQAL